MKPDSTILEVPCSAVRMAGFGNRKTYDRTLMRTIPRGSHRGAVWQAWRGRARRGMARLGVARAEGRHAVRRPSKFGD